MTETAISPRHETRCAGPDCAEPAPQKGRGRPALYHSPTCRAAAYRRARNDPWAPLTVEVDHGSTSSKGRPAGRVWLVRLRRGDRAVIVAAGLGRPSADNLAHQITQLLHPTPWPTEAPSTRHHSEPTREFRELRARELRRRRQAPTCPAWTA